MEELNARPWKNQLLVMKKMESQHLTNAVCIMDKANKDLNDMPTTKNLLEFIFIAIDCVWSDWGPFGECDKTCGAGYRHSTRTSTGPFYGGAECVGDATQKQACNLMEELEMALESCQAENKRLKQQVNCESSKCKITVYQEANANTETCGYLPDGLGDTECASKACPAVSGTHRLKMST